MTPTTLSEAVAAEHVRDLQRTAHASRLAALARCCHPSRVRGAASRTVAAFTTLVRRSATPATASCCA